MVLQELWELYRAEVFPVRSTDDLFNQYRDVDPDLDRPEGHRIRQENLKRYLESYSKRPTVLVVAEAAGPWGTRFSGVPLTNERSLVQGELPFTGRQSSLDEPAVRTGRKTPYSSSTPSIFWEVMAQFYPAFLAWYLVPFYPHVRGNAMKKRSPTDEEVTKHTGLLKEAIAIAKPKTIIAMGGRVASGVEQLGVEYEMVHHPAHDTRQQFPAGMRAIMGKVAREPAGARR
ncbi:MAG: uracil-DNA glycosylase family protein [Armatimonadota bacterium]